MQALATGSYQTVDGAFYGSPKEVWGFRTRRSTKRSDVVAREFLSANAPLLRLTPDLSDFDHARARIIESLGARHVILQQRYMGRRVHRAYTTVHMDLQNRVYLAKNRVVPADMLPSAAAFVLTTDEAIALARRILGGRGRSATELGAAESLWYPLDGLLRPAIKFRLRLTRPREEWIFYLDAETGEVLSAYDNVSAATRGRARVFDPSPVTELGSHDSLLSARGNPRRPPADAYRTVALFGLTGNGRLEGARVTTRPTRRRVKRANHDFLFDAHETGFEEAMAYHHVDSAIRYLERLGYRGSRAIFTIALPVNVRGTRQDNSWYSPGERMLSFGTGAIDDAEDGETILHEFGHALQDAICPDFGQSAEAAAMGEGFGDFLAASFFADRKPAEYRACVMTWDGLLLGLEDGTNPPALRHLDWDWTHDDFDESLGEHENGEIWSATLWDIWRTLGRDLADPMIIESHFQLDGFTTMARGARAILDADQNLNGGTNRAALVRIFNARRLGPLA